MYLVTLSIPVCVYVCKNKEKTDHELETEQEVESTAETLEGGKGMGKLYNYNLKNQSYFINGYMDCFYIFLKT